MDLIEKLFDNLIKENPLETEEIRKEYNSKFIEDIEDDNAQNDAWSQLCAVVWEAQLNAFRIGFNAAKELLR